MNVWWGLLEHHEKKFFCPKLVGGKKKIIFTKTTSDRNVCSEVYCALRLLPFGVLSFFLIIKNILCLLMIEILCSFCIIKKSRKL